MNKLQMLTGAFGLPAAMLSAVVGYYNYDKLVADKGPAIQINSVRLSPGYRGQPTRFYIEFAKIRNCLPEKATISLIDLKGFTHTINVPWENSFPVNPKIKALFIVNLPDTIPAGPIQSGQLEVTHHECKDGVSPALPATFPIEEFIVK